MCTRSALLLAVLSGALIFSGCGDSGSTDGGPGDGSTGDGSTGDGSMDGSTGDGSTGDGSTGDGSTGDGSVGDTQCTDGIDNDGDGLVDGFDPECTGAADNDEGSFGTGIPGDNRDPIWQDCFFDGNSGAGDDGCRYRTGCLTGDLPPDDEDCVLSAACIEFCAPRTPNGCDCFGCCEVTLEDGMTRTVAIGTGCSLADIDSCDACVQNTDCVNECGTCELCPGRTADDLPADCYDTPPEDGGMPMYTCDDGIACMSDADCTDSSGTTGYCALGCCLFGPI